MDLTNLKAADGAVKTRRRLGRGQGSGKGGTSTKGHKGAQSRSGYSRKIGNEGGQMPLVRRVPKFGFKNINRVEYRGVNLDRIQKLVEEKNVTVITIDTLIVNGLAKHNENIKILGKGELKSKVEITVHAFSKSAIKAIEDNGGTANKI